MDRNYSRFLLLLKNKVLFLHTLPGALYSLKTGAGSGCKSNGIHRYISYSIL